MANLEQSRSQIVVAESAKLMFSLIVSFILQKMKTELAAAGLEKTEFYQLKCIVEQ